MLLVILLFILLSPGMLLTLPPINGKFWMTRKTSVTSVLVHAAVFGLAVHLLKSYYYFETFQGCGAAPKKAQ